MQIDARWIEPKWDTAQSNYKTDNKFGIYYSLVAIDFKLVDTDFEGM